MRKAFSMITAIFVIVIMASLLALVSSLSGKIVKETTSQYRKEQAALLAKSYTEYAILAIQGHNMAANGCLATITSIINHTDLGGANAGGANDGEGYRATIRMQYFNLPAGIACATDSLSANNPLNPDVSVLVDVNIRYKDPEIRLDETSMAASPWISYNRRTLQRL